MKYISIYGSLTVFAAMLVTPCLSQENMGKASEGSLLPLKVLVEVKPRIQAYLKARTQQISELALKYEPVIEARLKKAAAAGDLIMATAFQEEKKRIGALTKILAAEEKDSFKAAQRKDTLADLPPRTQETLIGLRKIWTTEWQKIRAKLDADLQQSLKALEIKFTKEVDLESAKKILALRESLLSGAPVTVVKVAESTVNKVAEMPEGFTLLKKTVSYPHERNPDFMIRVKFKEDGEATFIGLGNFEVEWAYERGDVPSVYFFWSHTQGGTKKTGYRIDINPDGKNAIVSRGSNYKVKGEIKMSRR